MPYGVFWYLASPYSRYIGGPEEAYIKASQAAALLIQAKIPVFSPIAHTHPIAEYGGMDKFDLSIWLPADRPFIQLAHGIIVLELAGWDKSHGVREEINAFRLMLKPIVQMLPGIVPASLLALSSTRQVLGS